MVAITASFGIQNLERARKTGADLLFGVADNKK